MRFWISFCQTFAQIKFSTYLSLNGCIVHACAEPSFFKAERIKNVSDSGMCEIVQKHVAATSCPSSILGERIEHGPGHNASQIAKHNTQSCMLNSEVLTLHNMPGATPSPALPWLSQHEFSSGDVHSGQLCGLAGPCWSKLFLYYMEGL